MDNEWRQIMVLKYLFLKVRYDKNEKGMNLQRISYKVNEILWISIEML